MTDIVYSECVSVVELAQQCSAAEDPVLDWLVRGELNGEHIVCGVTGGGQDATPSTGLVEWTHIGTSIFDILLFSCVCGMCERVCVV